MSAGSPHALFISDLHLSETRPHISQLFLRFLDEVAPAAQTLFILGDLFEFWIGDDTLDEPLNAEVIAGLKRLAKRGTRSRFMHGNRDFLVGPAFAAAADVELLPDPTLLDLYGTPALLMHGDTLCTDDKAYQAFRAHVRNPEVQRQFLALPVPARRQQVGQVRAQADQQKQDKPPAIMDVTPVAVDDAVRAAGYAPRLIHGHTHRPARHEHAVDGHRCERWVLADWYERGEYLRVDAAGVTRVAYAG
ncbi:MAG: UDP-2,3-diacylglucosamine diphosphatase [Burkholderiales bacterium]|nr:UDP-2,3-diacylglucosamine diphosphatase [Burkholderiales bacterium]